MLFYRRCGIILRAYLPNSGRDIIDHMKLLSIAVPCYNSESYMKKCLDSLLAGGEDVEILIVDDGSTKDRTPEIADAYQEKYPTIVKAIHQENKGHGGAVNTGIDHATGLYFKVVDSDDWLGKGSFLSVLDTLRELAAAGRIVDVLFANYVYEKQNRKYKKYVMRYQMYLPENRIFGWDQVKRMNVFHYVLMHSLIYRTGLLREVGLRLPEHTFYVDNIYAFVPFSKVKTMYYLNVNLYRYFIGRSDQSVNEKVMMSRFPQQLRVAYTMLDYLEQFHKLRLHPKQRQFLLHDVSIIMIITTSMMLRSGDPEILKERKPLWNRLKKADYLGYLQIRSSASGVAMSLPGKGGGKVVTKGYHVIEKVFGFD